MLFINLFGGVLLLLHGIRLLNDGLQNAMGTRMRSLLRSLTSSRLSAVGGGALITGLIQSSSATSVMLVGFVSAGLMTFRQTLAVILGADIGATLTVQLIAFHVADYAILLVGIGLLLYLFPRGKTMRHTGEGLLGFGFVFLSLKLMTDAMLPLQSSELFRQVFVAFTETPWLGIVLSAALTALIHSSAATMGIALVLAQSGMMPLHAALYVVLGANIGTCTTAFLASLRTVTEARRVAWAHILFKVFGVALALPLLAPFTQYISMSSAELPRQIANANTVFNVAMALIFLPLLSPFARLVTYLVPNQPDDKKFGPMYLDDHVLGTPALALGQATREALRESDIVREMYGEIIKAFETDDQAVIEAIKAKDNLIDQLDRHIRLYITRLSSSHLTESQSRRALSVLEVARNIESIGDIIDRNIMPLALKRISKSIVFSEEGMREIELFHRKVLENFDMAISAFAANDRDLADQVLRTKEEVSALERELTQAHLERLRKGLRESIETSHIHLDLIGNLARINSLITHIIHPIAEEKRGRGREDVGIDL